MKHDFARRDDATDMLEDRLREVEASATSVEFDLTAWVWMILLGIAFPLGLIVYGWFLMVSAR